MDQALRHAVRPCVPIRSGGSLVRTTCDQSTADVDNFVGNPRLPAAKPREITHQPRLLKT